MGRVINKADYTFNKTAKTITFSSKYTGIELSQIQLITDVTNSTVIYQFNKTGYGGTLAGLVLTLTYDITGAGFNNTDDLMIIVNESQDNTILYSGTLTNTGSISGVDTTDQQTISIQVSGSWEGVVMVEGSNDNSYYVPLMVYPVNEISVIDNINENGIYNLTTSTKFVRLNVVQLQTGSINALIHGRLVDGPNAADMLSLAMDATQNMPLRIQDINGSPGTLKKDVNNALVLSDAPPIFTTNGTRNYNVNDVIFLIDTQGYQSLDVITTVLSFTCAVQISNDGVNWVASPSFPYAGSATYVQNITSVNTVHSIPCTSRYIRIIAGGTSTYNMTAVLKNTPPYLVGSTTGMPVYSTAPSSVTSQNPSGNTIATGYFVGGPNTNGSTTVTQPVMVGGRQAPGTGYAAGITRTMLMDSDGRVQIAADQTKALGTGTSLQLISSNFQNGNSLSVTDLSQHEGQGRNELLVQILMEMKITNRYLAELPFKLNAGLNNLDEPEDFRQDQTFFNI